MNKLLFDAIDAHGGQDRWKRVASIGVETQSGGELLERKVAQSPAGPLWIVAATDRQECRLTPLGVTDRVVISSANRTTMQTADGKLLAERIDPRAEFNGHDLDTPWDLLHRMYFASYAMWSYLTAPFSLAMPGVQLWDIDPIEENGELWRGMRAVMPEGFATHSRAQEFYFGDDMILRRQDYTIDIAGGSKVANYAQDVVEIDGIKIASKRRAYLCNKRYEVLWNRLMVRLELSNFRLTLR
jgi:hypothetical protein